MMKKSQQTLLVYAITIAVGAALTLFQIQHQAHFISDTLIYLSSAIHFQDGGLKAAMQIYPWPFYSVLIATVQSLTGLSMLISGYVVNAFFQSWLIIAFLSVVRCFDKRVGTLACAALLMLVYVKFNTLRAELLRDFAYWAMLLTALWAFVRYIQSEQLRYIGVWSAFIALACLFRIEGLFIATLLPLSYSLVAKLTLRQRLQQLALLNIPIITVVITWCVLTFFPHISLGRLAYLPALITSYIDSTQHVFSQHSQTIASQVLPTTTAKYSYIFLLTGALSVFIIIVCKTLTPTYCFLTIYSFWCQAKAKVLTANPMRLLYAFIGINLALCLIFFAWRYFIISRYLMAMNFGLLVIVSLHLSELVRYSWKEKRISLATVFLAFVTIGMMTLALHSTNRHFPNYLIKSKPSKYTYLKEAWLWCREHLNSEITLLSNDETVAYFAAKNKRQWLQNYWTHPRKIDDIMAKFAQNKNAVIALNIPRNTYPLMKQELLLIETAVAKFTNPRGDLVLVIRKNEVD